MFSLLESVAFDMGYSGPNGLVQQSWENGNGTSYIYFGAGEFDGQGSGHDYLGTVSFLLVFFFFVTLIYQILLLFLRAYRNLICLIGWSDRWMLCCAALLAVVWLHQQLRRRS